MKATYERPTLTKREALTQITADIQCAVSGYYGDRCGSL